MKGIFENGRFYRIQEKGSDGFTWRGGCTGVHIDDYWTVGQYMQDFQVEDADAEIITYIAKDGEVWSSLTYETIEVKKSTEEYTLFTVSARIPHGPSEYFEMFDDCTEVRGIKVPSGKRLLVKNILKVDLQTGDYEVPEGYTVEEVQSINESQL